MSVTIAPPMFLQFLNQNNSGSPAIGYQLFTYQAGTTTKQATWTDSTQTVQNANPLPLDGNGVGNLWGDPTLAYKFVWAPANDTDPPTSPLRTVDNLYFPLNIAALTQSVLGSILYPRTAAESAAGVTPVNYSYPAHSSVGYVMLERYGGGIGVSATANSVAFASAVLVSGQVDCPIGITAGLGTWSFNQPWVLSGTGQSLAGNGPPVGGTGATGCRVIGIRGRPDISFTGISTSADCITLGGANLPQVELRDLVINFNGSSGSPNGRDGIVILGSSHPIVDNILTLNSQRDAFVLAPSGTSAEWIERGEFSLSLYFCGRHAVNMSLQGTANPFINECVWKILEVRGVSFITAGGNAIAHNAASGLGGAAKSADHVFLKTVFDCRYVTSAPPAGYTDILPDTSPVKAYGGVLQNWVFIAPAWENTGAVLVGSGTLYNVSTNSGAGTIHGLTMLGALTNSFWSNTTPDPAITQLFNFDSSYLLTALQGPLTITGQNNETNLVLSGQTTASTQPDISVSRTGTASSTFGESAGIELSNSTGSTGFSLQEFTSFGIFFGFVSGAWTELARILASGVHGGLQLGQKSAMYSGTGAPSGIGVTGDYYFRQDTPGTANQRIYVNNGGTWNGIV